MSERDLCEVRLGGGLLLGAMLIAVLTFASAWVAPWPPRETSAVGYAVALVGMGISVLFLAGPRRTVARLLCGAFLLIASPPVLMVTLLPRGGVYARLVLVVLCLIPALTGAAVHGMRARLVAIGVPGNLYRTAWAMVVLGGLCLGAIVMELPTPTASRGLVVLSEAGLAVYLGGLAVTILRRARAAIPAP
jgi:hypothetical protein